MYIYILSFEHQRVCKTHPFLDRGGGGGGRLKICFGGFLFNDFVFDRLKMRRLRFASLSHCLIASLRHRLAIEATHMLKVIT